MSDTGRLGTIQTPEKIPPSNLINKLIVGSKIFRSYAILGLEIFLLDKAYGSPGQKQKLIEEITTSGICFGDIRCFFSKGFLVLLAVKTPDREADLKAWREKAFQETKNLMLSGEYFPLNSFTNLGRPV